MNHFQGPLQARVLLFALGLSLMVAMGYLFPLSTQRADAAEPTLTITAGSVPLEQTPVEFTLPSRLREAKRLWLTTEAGKTIAVQRVPGDELRAVCIVKEKIPAGESRKFRLRAVGDPSRDAESGRGVSIVQRDGRLTVLVGKQPALVYHTAVAKPPGPLEATYQRSGFIHPLYSPDGRVLTDDFPPDHAHQHGLFFAWVNTSFAGNKVDFWNQMQKTGAIEHVAVEQVVEGPVFAQFRAKLRHLDLTTLERPRPVLEETWTIRVYNIADPLLIDFESRQTCAGDEPLVINEYHYGGLALRGNRAWFDEQAKGVTAASERNAYSNFLTSEGRGRADGNHTSPRWVDMFGKVDGRFCGVALLDSPANSRFPQPVRLHPSKPYFCFAPMVSGKFTIAPGEPYVSRYRLVTHKGEPDRERLDQLWRQFAAPARTQVVP